VTEPVNVWDYERLAEEKLDPGVWGYYAGGAMDEVTLRENVEAYGRWRLRPRVLVDVDSVDTGTTILGVDVSMPLLVAPFAYQRMLDPQGELATARAAEAAGTIMCLSTIANSSPAEVAAAAPGVPRWFQLYVFRDWGVTASLLDQAVEGGFSAIALTVDTPYLGRRERDFYTGFTLSDELPVPAIHQAAGSSMAGPLIEHFKLMSPSVSWKDIERLASHCGLPVLVKGLVTREDAHLACEHGAGGIIVSNHGGRQLDGVMATLDALPEVVEAVDGRIPVLVDGGIRRGTDVLKALALGAEAALTGRACAYALAARGEAGVRHVLALLKDEIRLGLALLGCCSPREVERSHLARAVAYDHRA
jgi:(S)-2-hydroxy-acid oxidase